MTKKKDTWRAELDKFVENSFHVKTFSSTIWIFIYKISSDWDIALCNEKNVGKLKLYGKKNEWHTRISFILFGFYSMFFFIFVFSSIASFYTQGEIQYTRNVLQFAT